MSDIKWVKITTDMFDNRKIKYLRKLPDGDKIVLIWVMLLTIAGRCNSGGMIFLVENIPYTPNMLADELGFDVNTVILAIDQLTRLGMIIQDADTLMIANWLEYQSVDGMDKIREQTKNRMREYRERQKLGVKIQGETCAYCGNPASTVDHIIPRSKGGMDVAENLVPCCKSCNSSKKDKDLAEFLNDSFFYDYQNVNHDLVRSNDKLMSFVSWDENTNSYEQRYVTVTNTSISISNSKSKKKEFIPPTLEEVIEYCKSRNSSVDPKYFYEYFTVGHWIDSEGKQVKNWKQKLITWERKGARNDTRPNSSNGRTSEGKKQDWAGINFYSN